MALAVFPNQQISLGNVDEMKESVSMAIQALSQEPTDEYIRGYNKGFDEGTEYGIKATVEPCDDIYRKAWLELDRLIGKAPKPNLPKNMVESDSTILKRIRDLFWEVSRVLFYKTDYEPFLQEPCDDDRKRG